MAGRGKAQVEVTAVRDPPELTVVSPGAPRSTLVGCVPSGCTGLSISSLPPTPWPPITLSAYCAPLHAPTATHPISGRSAC